MKIEAFFVAQSDPARDLLRDKNGAIPKHAEINESQISPQKCGDLGRFLRDFYQILLFWGVFLSGAGFSVSNSKCQGSLALSLYPFCILSQS